MSMDCCIYIYSCIMLVTVFPLNYVLFVRCEAMRRRDLPGPGHYEIPHFLSQSSSLDMKPVT